MRDVPKIHALRDLDRDRGALRGHAARHNARHHGRHVQEDARQHPDQHPQLGHLQGVHEYARVRAPGVRRAAEEALRQTVPQGDLRDLPVHAGHPTA